MKIVEPFETILAPNTIKNITTYVMAFNHLSDLVQNSLLTAPPVSF